MTTSASGRWGRHYLRCSTCYVAPTVAEAHLDRFCDTGRELRDLSVSDALRILRSQAYCGMDRGTAAS